MRGYRVEGAVAEADAGGGALVVRIRGSGSVFRGFGVQVKGFEDSRCMFKLRILRFENSGFRFNLRIGLEGSGFRFKSRIWGSGSGPGDSVYSFGSS